MMNSPDAVESSNIAEMEETIARISSHKGVEGVMIMDRRGGIWHFSWSFYCNDGTFWFRGNFFYRLPLRGNHSIDVRRRANIYTRQGTIRFNLEGLIYRGNAEPRRRANFPEDTFKAAWNYGEYIRNGFYSLDFIDAFSVFRVHCHCPHSPLQDFSGQGFSIGCVAKSQINRMKVIER